MLSAVVTVFAIVLFVAVTQWIGYRLTRGRMWSAQWMAFSFTACALLFLVAGIAGFKLGRPGDYFDPTSWTNHVIWSQMAIGAVMVAAASVCWVIALRAYRPGRAMRP
jgi:hypothetical protein